MSIIESTDACKRANAYAELLRGRLNELFCEEQVPWAAYGTFSGFHIFTNPAQREIDPQTFEASAIEWREIKQNPPGVSDKLRLAMLINGVDITGWPGARSRLRTVKRILTRLWKRFANRCACCEQRRPSERVPRGAHRVIRIPGGSRFSDLYR